MQQFERVRLACYNMNQSVGQVRVDVLGRKGPGGSKGVKGQGHIQHDR